MDKLISMHKEICLDPKYPMGKKIEAFLSLNRTSSEEGKEMLTRWRDMIPHIPNQKDRDVLIAILAKIAKIPEVDPHERSMIAVCLYNRYLLDICYPCFESIAIDDKVPNEYRVEACRYLYSTEDDTRREMAKECLINILDDQSILSEVRYRIIHTFISRSGVSSYLNAKIRVAYNEEFVYSLQTTFFNETKNGIRERMLSGQHILQMDCSSEEDKTKVIKALLSIATDDKYTENTRADAADIVLRLAPKEYSVEARSIINKLGHSAVNIRSDNIMDRIKTLYTNSQNIHDEPIANMVNTFIEKMLNDDINPVPFEDVSREVSILVRSKKMPKEKNFIIYKALNRISIDTATFTSKNATLSEIFVHVWLRIKQYEGDVRILLENRLIEELIDMGDTCSSGHSGRFVNILSTVDPELDIKISFEAQIVANVAGRVHAKIRDTKDDNIKGSIALGMLPNSSVEDSEIYKKFIDVALKEIREEMVVEFVEGKYLSNSEFSEYFSKASEQWIKK